MSERHQYLEERCRALPEWAAAHIRFLDQNLTAQKQRARIAEQREAELVEAAFREGHFIGRCGGGEMSDEDDDWKASLHRAILAKHEQENP